jgi:hypothetical protein
MPDVPSLGNGVAVPITAEDYPELLESLRQENLPAAEAEFLVDWMGVRTRIPMLPWAPGELAGATSTQLPIPDDGYRSEDFEYVALARTVRDVVDRPLVMVEIGAGWAPWAVAGLVSARGRGISGIAVAIEADRRKCTWAVQHGQDNGLDVATVAGKPRHLVRRLREAIDSWNRRDPLLIVVESAAWHETTTVEFPDAPIDDMGTAVWTLPGTNVDYRGAHLRHSSISALGIPDLLEALAPASNTRVDLLHVDVQGVEFELLERTASAIQDNTRLMAVGTHNRLSEGRLQYFFLERGWGLLIDQPCKARFTMTHPTLSGFTEQDGMQLWENPFVL